MYSLPQSSIADCLAAAAAQLTGRASPRVDAEVLLAHVLGETRSHLHAWPDQSLSNAQQQRYLELIARRAAGEPVAYLTGEREFWSLPLVVNRHTLIPRADTECLVELALALIPSDAERRIADIGTGSGAIALAIASERPRCHVIATDLSRDALAVARHNAQRLQLRNIEFRAGDGVAPLHGERLDLICSNPPYVAAGDPHLDSGDLPAEPRSALVAGPTGLEVLTAIGRDAPAALRSGGWLLLEHGYDQGAAVHCLLTSLDYRAVATHRDHADNDRVTLGRRD